MIKQYILIEISPEKAEELIHALEKRPYIKILSLNKEERERLESCPACGRKFHRESTVTVTADMLPFLVRLLRRMRMSKSLVLINKRNPIEKIPEFEKERAIPFPYNLVEKAELLGLIRKFIDGSTETYFVTKKGLAFLSGKEPLSPSRYMVADGKVLETSGQLFINEVKFTDRVDHDKVIQEAKRAAEELPQRVLQFIEKGQIFLV